MKRIFLLCMIFSVAILESRAQDNSDFWTIKAGVNFANFINSDYSSDCQTGFNVGVLRAYSLSKSLPIYVQSGLSFEMKGAQNSFAVDGFGVKQSVKSYALEVPVLLNYGISISQKSTLHPFVGVYYSFTLCGEIEENGETMNPYKKNEVQFSDMSESTKTRIYNRSDFGVRVGLDYKYTRYSIGMAYDIGVLNMYAKAFRDRNYEASTGSLSINLGYYF